MLHPVWPSFAVFVPLISAVLLLIPKELPFSLPRAAFAFLKESLHSSISRFRPRRLPECRNTPPVIAPPGFNSSPSSVTRRRLKLFFLEREEHGLPYLQQQFFRAKNLLTPENVPLPSQVYWQYQ